MLERAHDGGADRDDPPALCLRAPDRRCSRVRDAVGLVERQASIELRVAGGGESGRVRDRVERIAAIDRQSSAKPADGGSKATGGPAIGVHTSHSASGTATCAYWMGLP